MYIGKRMKELRKSQGMTLVELADKSGVQVATISRIENHKMVGSLESHMALAKALNVDVTQLYNGFSKKDTKIDIKRPGSSEDVFVHSDKSAYEILTNKVLSKKMMPTLIKIDPDGQTASEQGPLGSEKFIYVLEGSVEIHIAENAYTLSTHNTLYFDASSQHWYTNKGKTAVKLLCVGTPV
ncbi:MAG: helix-turn-helix transcriptional regulator, partial [Candidatus Omnitrophica bacterium]|nr:helix-turn-helix transcriptional regulator [Candidatus Omnitrophota bacterium]